MLSRLAIRAGGAGSRSACPRPWPRVPRRGGAVREDPLPPHLRAPHQPARRTRRL